MSASTHPIRTLPADCVDPVITTWFDAHNHLHDARLGGDAHALIAAQKSAGVCGSVVNATREEDWPLVADLARCHPEFIRPAFGIHPWHAHTARAGWQERLVSLLEEFPSASIGECGIDGWISAPPLAVQMPLFLEHIRIAREAGRAMTIHCLKAWGPLFECLQQQAPPARFLMHSFGGSRETALRLAGIGAWFSFSGYFLHERKHAVLDVFRQIPQERILLETDAPDMLPPDEHVILPLPGKLNHPANLPAIGAALADHLTMQACQLAQLTRGNTAAWLGL